MTIDSPAVGTAEYLVQFLHPEKMLGLIPAPGGLDELLAEPILGVTPDQVESARDAFTSNVRAHARRLLDSHPELRREIGSLGLATDTTVAAVGDSITDDLQSWAYLLGQLLREDFGGPGSTVLNFGRSADTTADLICRLDRVLAAQPDIIVFQVGSNDAKQFAHSPGQPLVSPAETVRNVAMLDRAARRSGARVAWILPPTPDFTRLDSCPWFVGGGMKWDAETFTATRAAISSVVNASVDPHTLLDEPSDLLDDGLHPSAWGQAKICRALITLLASAEAGAR